jgi:glycosyltransferase involved in cell wall biosynthesis
MKKRIVFFHLLNDYSGSPNILALIIKGVVTRGYIVDLYTSSERDGFLSHIEGVKYHHVYYDFSKNKIKTLFLLIFAQITCFFAVFKYIFNKNVVIYINTIYPFGAAIGAVITRKRLIYHVHEKPVKQNIFSYFALFILNNFADRVIYVSRYLYDNSSVKDEKKALVYNALSPEFVSQAKLRSSYYKPYNVLMVCSLRKFKGVFIFCEIAAQLPQYKFTLVLNSTDEEIKSFFKRTTLPENLEILSSKTNIHSFYCKAHLVVNLSIPNLCVESFGLTALEAMTYGIPVIVPPVGGISEIVDEGVQGFKVDSRNLNLLIDRIRQIFNDEQKYSLMSAKAREKAEYYSYSKIIDEIEHIIKE